MRRLIVGLTVGLLVASSAFVQAQKTTELKTGNGGSPHVRTDWTIDGANLSVEYGRPFLKGRPEAQMMPPGREWRTGADAATIITTDKALKFGSVSLAPGSYTINTVPGEKEWQIVFGRLEKPGQWGVPYKKELEIGRTAMNIGKTAKPIENVTISIDDTPANGAMLRVEWGTASATVPFTIG
ncbi:MAG TPA: DUF2911 domain-containing protein [Vicinamibacterales bacterium]|nr:DUF2911 domain-containing protein [Vicinamibacterales bacterium]